MDQDINEIIKARNEVERDKTDVKYFFVEKILTNRRRPGRPTGANRWTEK